jgi:sarcosine oxidase subunit delta
MLQLPCPWCGLRDESEFSHRGAVIARPNPGTATDLQWIDYLYFQSNVRGWQREYWAHTHGCQQLIVVRRDTRTNEIEIA